MFRNKVLTFRKWWYVSATPCRAYFSETKNPFCSVLTTLTESMAKQPYPPILYACVDLAPSFTTLSVLIYMVVSPIESFLKECSTVFLSFLWMRVRSGQGSPEWNMPRWTCLKNKIDLEYRLSSFPLSPVYFEKRPSLIQLILILYASNLKKKIPLSQEASSLAAKIKPNM